MIEINNIEKSYGELKVLKNINIQSGTNGNKTVSITAVDFFDKLSVTPTTSPAIAYKKTLDQAIELFLDSLPHQPLTRTISTSYSTFPTVFDFIQTKTKPLTELSRLIASEPSYCYLRTDGTGENFVVENRNDRYLEPLKQIAKPDSLLSLFITETGENLITEDGDQLLANENIDMIFDNNMLSLSSGFGDSLVNSVRCRVYPRKFDTENVTLYEIDKPIQVQAGETKTFRLAFRDPANKAQKVSAFHIAFPFASEDYRFTLFENGDGEDRKADLDLSYTASPADMTLTIVNNSGYAGFFWCRVKGKAIYTYDTADILFEDEASISAYRYSALEIDMRYRDSLSGVSLFPQRALANGKDPKLDVKKIEFKTTTDNELLLNAFLFLDIGDLIRVKEYQTGIDKYFYIHGKDFVIEKSDTVSFSYIVKEAVEKSASNWILGDATYSLLGDTTIL